MGALFVAYHEDIHGTASGVCQQDRRRLHNYYWSLHAKRIKASLLPDFGPTRKFRPKINLIRHFAVIPPSPAERIAAK